MMATTTALDPDFPCSLVISIPLPTFRLASSALRALQVDMELSPLVRRSFSLEPTQPADGGDETTVLHTHYKATTDRMLRVAVNGFMESIGVVLRVMEELDVDVLAQAEEVAKASN
ncbi:MAG: hypothetical protein M1832_003936 [Thelocarpon impressellum]|nr:MAG: hypothetical protein M1832_003936 [Thelocarpon impressellum]